MSLDNLIAEIDAEIAQLRQARVLLSGAASPAAKKTGRPASGAKAIAPKWMKKKRRISPEGRARIVAAVKVRWARQKKQ